MKGFGLNFEIALHSSLKSSIILFLNALPKQSFQRQYDKSVYGNWILLCKKQLQNDINCWSLCGVQLLLLDRELTAIVVNQVPLQSPPPPPSWWVESKSHTKGEKSSSCKGLWAVTWWLVRRAHKTYFVFVIFCKIQANCSVLVAPCFLLFILHIDEHFWTYFRPVIEKRTMKFEQ